MTVYALTFLLFLAKGEPVIVAQVYGDRVTCQVIMGKLADKAQTDQLVVGWEFLGKPCEPIREANKV